MQLLSVLAFLGASSAKTCQRANLVTFGDSFSDTGNVAVLSNGTWPANNRTVFTNGLVWNQLLADRRKLALTSYAYGGATANSTFRGYSGPKSDLPVPSVNEQVTTYLADKVAHRGKTYYIFLVGGNDKFFYSDLSGAEVAQYMANDIALLQAQKTGSVFVLNLPPLEKIPYFNGADNATLAFFAGFVQDYNSNILAISEKTKAFTVVDIHTLVSDIIASPPKYGFAPEQATGCVYTCAEPNQFIFWDAFHFTERAYSFIAELTATYLK